jgi:hypothetical protein
MQLFNSDVFEIGECKGRRKESSLEVQAQRKLNSQQ